MNPSMLRVLNQYPVRQRSGFRAGWRAQFQRLPLQCAEPSQRQGHRRQNWISISIAAGKHTLTFRGTVAHNTDDLILAQFPGQGPASTLRDKSMGFAAQYTATSSVQTLVNVFNFGYTRFAQSIPALPGRSCS